MAVSGGVDSVVLLHKLTSKKPEDMRYIVAHYDHGIRADSAKDAEFVRDIAAKLGLIYESENGQLGSNASEALAREKRYDFLRRVKNKYEAERIITAHHVDDVIETMIINILRGTGPRGLVSLTNTKELLRPLINSSKDDLLIYAKNNDIKWREDPSNESEDYLRNYVRMKIAPSLKSSSIKTLSIRKKLQDIYFEVDGLLEHIVPSENILRRSHLLHFDWASQTEIIRQWLIKAGVQELDSQKIHRITVASKTLPIGKKVDIDERRWLVSDRENVSIQQKVEGRQV